MDIERVEGTRQECITLLERLASESAFNDRTLTQEAKAAVEFLHKGADCVYAGDIEYQVVEPADPEIRL